MEIYTAFSCWNPTLGRGDLGPTPVASFLFFFYDEGMERRSMVSATSSRSFTSTGEVWRRRGAEGEHRCMPKTFWQTTGRLSFKRPVNLRTNRPTSFSIPSAHQTSRPLVEHACHPNTDRIRFDSSRPSGEIVRIDADVDAIILY